MYKCKNKNKDLKNMAKIQKPLSEEISDYLFTLELLLKEENREKLKELRLKDLENLYIIWMRENGKLIEAVNNALEELVK